MPELASWWQAVPALLGALALLWLPGLLLGLAARLRSMALWALAPALSLATIGIGGIVAQWLGIDWSWWVPLALAAIVTIPLALLARRRGLAWAGAPSTSRPRWPVPLSTWPMFCSLLAAAVVIAIRLMSAYGSPALVPQTYDGVFHLNASEYISMTGNGSSMTLYSISKGPNGGFYPAAWHDTVSAIDLLTGSGVPIATSALAVVVAAVVWPLAVVFLARTLFGTRRAVTIGAALLAAGTAAFPYLLLDWGTLFPTFLAYAIFPLGLALAAHLLGAGEIPHCSPLRAIGLGLGWLCAAALCHPRSLFGFAVCVLPLLVGFAWRWIARQRTLPEGRRRIAVRSALVAGAGVVVAAAGIVVLYKLYGGTGRPISDRLNGGPAQASMGWPQAIADVLTLSPVDSTNTQTPWNWPWAILLIVGVIAIWRCGRGRWLVVATALLGALYCLAAASNSDLAKLATGLWYKDKERLISLIPTLAIPIAALGASWLWDHVRSATERRWMPVVAGGVAAAMVAATSLTGSVSALATTIHADYALSTNPADDRMLTADEYALIQELPQWVGPDDVIVSDPWNGSSYAMAIADRKVMFPHMTGQPTPNQQYLLDHIDQIDTDPHVCQALQAESADYYLDFGPLMWGGDVQAAPYHQIDELATAAPDALTLVAAQGQAKLYRITGCQ